MDPQVIKWIAVIGPALALLVAWWPPKSGRISSEGGKPGPGRDPALAYRYLHDP